MVTQQYDAIVIGAGVSGLYALYKLRELGLSARVFEAGSDIGGTWYWNRYPGGRFDSESYTYQYSFPQELIDGPAGNRTVFAFCRRQIRSQTRH